MSEAHIPKITLLTPCFNSVSFIERTILSVLNQQYPNLEYIVLDGGSTDGSVDIIRKYEKSLASWRSRRDGGHAASLNEGFANASGEILSFVNSDDVLLPGALHAVAAGFRRSSKTSVVFGKTLMIDAEDKITYRICGIRPTYYSMLFWSMAGFSQPATFFRKSVLEHVGPFQEGLLAFDYEFFLRVLRDFRFQKVNRYLAGYRIHDGSITGSRWEELVSETESIRRQYGVEDYNPVLRTAGKAAYWSRYKAISGYYRAKHFLARTENVDGYR